MKNISAGVQLGSHVVTALLGREGMGGAVYRARDTKLKRDVAVKILPDEFSRDTERVARFQREAEILASLNHPNIAAIYDLAEDDGVRFLVLELVEGEMLAERIRRGDSNPHHPGCALQGAQPAPPFARRGKTLESSAFPSLQKEGWPPKAAGVVRV